MKPIVNDGSSAGVHKAYFIGGGIASLSGAVLLIRDGGFRGENIEIFEQNERSGGGLDAVKSGKDYISRGGRMFEEHYSCTLDVLSEIPSINNKNITVKDDIYLFNRDVVSNAQCRLVVNNEKVDVSSYGLSFTHLWEMFKLIINFREKTHIEIREWFSPDFFKTKFWLLWTTSFSFQPWDNVDELRRYFLRFIHLLPGFNHYENILRTRFNQYDSMIAPMVEWLKSNGVRIHQNNILRKVEFENENKKVPSVYRGFLNPIIVWRAIKALLR